ncbi:MAG: polyprenol monophosphomannose synthase [Actinomycetota bacterium]
MKTFVVLPTYNESENIKEFVHCVFKLHPEFNILIVDDNSPDGTGMIADEMSREDNRVSVIHRPGKLGLGTAYIAGFKYALSQGADLIFEMDADFSHRPEYLTDFIEAAKKYDLVIGSRYVNGVRVEGWQFRRLLLSKFANIFVSYMLILPVWDFTAGFRCYRRRVLESIELDKIKSDGYAFQIEMTYLTFKHNFSVFETPIIFRERKGGISKISRKVINEAFWITLKLRASIFKIIKHSSYLFKDYNDFVNNYHKE